MNTPEGKIILCLDEFMLRMGHLKVLANAAAEAGSGSRKLLASCAERLGQLMLASEVWHTNLPTYLVSKKLCHVLTKSDDIEPKYPSLIATKDATGEWMLTSLDDEPIMVTWQDACLSDPLVPSCVGAVKHTRRGDSKSPLSHILDWADALELVSLHGELTFAGKLLVARTGSSRNPYVIGNEAVLLLWLFAKQDYDALFYLIPNIAKQNASIAKAEARSMFVAAVNALSNQAEESRDLSAHARSRIFSQLRELEIGDDGTAENLSTAWHRTSSRFESLVDLGVLRKGDASEQSRYKYTYRKTRIIDSWNSSLVNATQANHWMRTAMLDEYAADQLGVTEKTKDSATIVEAVVLSARQISSPSKVYPLDLLLVGAVCNLLDRKCYANVSDVSRVLEQHLRADPKRGNYVASRTETEAGGVTLYL